MAKEENSGWLKLESRFRLAAWSIGALLLVAPLVAMRFTSEVNWTVGDFVFAGLLIGGTGAVYELAARTTSGLAYRAGVGVALAASFLLIWINGAVGIIGSENEVANRLYAGVIAIALLGSILAGFRRRRMAWVMTAAAVAQALVPVAAWLFGWASPDLLLRPEVSGSTVVFTALWLMSAWLFRKAAEAPTAS